jgi:hypothetical protein
MEAPTANGANGNTFTQNASDAYHKVANGPLVQNVKEQQAKTSGELSALMGARRPPTTVAATGQPLTHYHSFFSELLSWNNPRASAIAYAASVLLIFAARYLDILRYAFKLTWMVLGVTIAAEVVGKLIMSNGITSQVRPRSYYVVPRETLDAMIGDVHELVNFFVIEAQRILFAENVPTSVTIAVAAFLSYHLVKIVPYWGLALIFTTLSFLVPVAYTSNQELIDNALQQASTVVSAQTHQLRDVAAKHTVQATHITKQYMGDYTSKAQNMLRRRSVEVNEGDFPSAPTNFPLKSAPHHEPLADGERATAL